MDRDGIAVPAARTTPMPDKVPQPRKPRLRRILVVAAIVVFAALAVLVARHPIAGFVLSRGLWALTGDRVSFGSFVVGRSQSVLQDLRVVTASGEDLISARRLVLRYSLGDAVTNRDHRFGITFVAIDEPTLTLIRHRDGSYNLGGAGRSGSPAAGVSSGTPFVFRMRVRDGSIKLLDRSPVAADLREQDIRRLSLDADVATAGRSQATGGAVLFGRRAAVAAVTQWPIVLRASSDVPRGIAIVHASAPVMPLRGAISFVLHSGAVRFDDGLLHRLDLTLFSLDLGRSRAPTVHLGGRAELSDGVLTLGSLRKPVRSLRGSLALTDDGVWSSRLAGSIAGLPIAARGGLFDRHAPKIRLGLAAAGDLTDLRKIFAFSRLQPVAGRAQVQTLLEAPVSSILIRTAIEVPDGRYNQIPFAGLAGRVDYHANSVVLDAVRARYGALRVAIGGRILLGGPSPDTAITVSASGPARGVPYAENLAPEGALDALSVIRGRAGFRAEGAIGVRGRGLAGRGMFAVDERGAGEFGPFMFERSDGSSLVGALRLERPTSRSAAWISARRYRIELPARAGRLAGLHVPAFPPIGGVLDASLAGGGFPNAFRVAGQVRGHELRAGTIALGSGQALLGGQLGDIRLSKIRLAGPLGRFGGTAAFTGSTFALRGDYDGSLERLIPLTGRQLAYGSINGPVAATLDGRSVVVQSAGAALRGGQLRGVAVDRAAGTVAIRGKIFTIVAADGSIGGRRAVARESNGSIAVSAPDLPSTALRATGVPLDAGNLSVYGLADLRGRSAGFHGTVAVAAGRAHGYRVAGDAQIDLDGARAVIHSATGALGSTYGSIDGSIDGIGERDLRFDLGTHVPLGDLDLLRADLRLPLRHLGGSFATNLHITGPGSQPVLAGLFRVPEGVYNGLAFRDGTALVRLDPTGASMQDGRLTVGSTRAVVAARVSAARVALSAGAQHADLADFDDYFDAGDTLAGKGRFRLAFDTGGGRTQTQGLIDLSAVRYRGFPIGDSQANWQMRGAAIVGHVRLASLAGRAQAQGQIIPAAGADPVRALHNAEYRVTADLAGIDVGRWLPAAGIAQPVLGKLSARLRVFGRQPSLAIGLDATLADATVAGFPITAAQLQATSRGSRVTVRASRLELGFATLVGSGTLGWSGTDPLAFDLQTTTGDIGPAVHRFIPAARTLDVAGALEADIRVSGTRAAPRVAGGFDLTNARYTTFVIPRAIGAVALAGRAIELRDADVEFLRGQAFVAGSLPLTLQPLGFGPARAPLSFDVTARGVDLAQFSPLLPTGTKLGGTVDGRFGVEGSVDRPRMLGSLAIANGSYLSGLERAPIQHFDARLAFDGSRVALQTFHAAVGTGTLDAGGQLNLPFGTTPRASYALDVRANAAEFDFPAYGRGTIDGALRLSGGGAAPPLLAGSVALRNAGIPVAAVYGSAGGSTNTTVSMPFEINPVLAIHASAEKDVRIRSGIVDVGVTGTVDLTGTLRAPKLAGAFIATDGTISSYNHVFRLVNASATFNPADGTLPTIDARATARVTNPDPDSSRNIAGSAAITVAVSGTPDSNNLQVTYSSDPAYSQEQIVGLLLDVPALLGAVNFNLNGGTGGPALRGAPGETNVLLPPGVSPEQVSAISFNQEVFSLLNGQFTQRALTPIERVFEKIFGLSDLEFTVDYGGGIGYSLRRQIGKRDFYAFLSQTVTYPERTNFGFELEPKPFETVNFSYYEQNGVTSLITNQTPGAALFSGSTRRLTSVQPLGNRSGFSLNFNRRF